MNSIAKIAGGALAAILVTTTLAMAGNGQVVQIDKSKLQLAKIAGCTVAGTPSEFPDDLRFTNKGVGTLKAGTKISWTLTGYNTKGTYTLVADLSPGATAFAAGVLGGGVEAGHDCKAKVL
jgi:invasion protein IalB